MVILIKDLPASVELDRQAMTAIAGGARVRGRQTSLGGTIVRRDRSVNIINYPTGFAGTPSADTEASGSKPPGDAADD